MEQLAIAPAAMRARIEETLDLLGIADLRHRALRTLSGGQQQRVAIGAALTAHPRVLVLDEPTSALDPTSAEDVLAAITRLVHDLGVTVVLAEHRLERVRPYADRVIYLPGDGTVDGWRPADDPRATAASPADRRARQAGRLGPAAAVGARRPPAGAGPLRGQLPAPPADARPVPQPDRSARAAADRAARADRARHRRPVRPADRRPRRRPDLRRGEFTALMGRNGSGKSSLLWALQGAGRPGGGTVSVGPDRADPAARRRAARGGWSAWSRRPPPTCSTSTRSAGRTRRRPTGTSATARDGRPAGILDAIAPGIPDDAHPRDLSAGSSSRWCWPSS